MKGVKPDYRALHDAEDRDFAAYLRSLDDADWEKPTLCTGWRVRDVIGHILYGNEMNWFTLPFKMARFGFSSDRSGSHYSAARAEGRSPQQLVEEFENRNAWAGTCRVFPAKMVLIDRLAHHQDIRRPLGHHRVVPDDRLLASLDATPSVGGVFRSKKRVKGLRLEATDVDWSYGDGPVVRGPGEALLMAMLGRGQAVTDLEGDGLATFAGRMLPPVTLP
jgi:uncharacterized protein (TIGR03083 family)